MSRDRTVNAAGGGLDNLGVGPSVTMPLAAAGGPALLADLREQYGIGEGAMRRLLATLERQQTRPDDVVPRLRELAAWLGEVRGQLLKPANDDADVRRLKSIAAAALADGDLEGAAEALRRLRHEVRDGRRRAEERLQEEMAGIRARMLEEARATVRLAEVASARGDHALAAELFAEASYALPASDREGTWRLGFKRAEALGARASEGDGSLLKEAIAAYDDVVRHAAEAAGSRGYAMACLGLGRLLLRAAEAESGSARAKEAAQALRKATAGLKRAEQARDWATAHLALARSLVLVSERDGDAAGLMEAADAYREALKELDSPNAPQDGVAARMGLGSALLALEEREGGTALLVEAAQCFENVLSRVAAEDGKAEDGKDVWIEARSNLGLALLGLGEQGGGAEQLERAVEAFDAVLAVIDRATHPQRWAVVQLNLGNALAAIGDRDGAGTQRLEAAIDAYGAALGAIDRSREPLKWAITQLNLGTAYIRLGERKDKRRHWLTAASTLVPALEVFEQQGADSFADIARRNLHLFHESWESLIAGTVAPTAEAPGRPRLSNVG